jgi:hypothetical protein
MPKAVELLPVNERIRFTRPHQILWNSETKEIICEVVDAGEYTVTECWRAGVVGFESADRNGQQVYYVGKHGIDTNSGLSNRKALLTIGEAITLATAESPATDNRFVIVIEDNGIYAESFTLPSWVSLHAPNIKVEGSIILQDNVNALVGEVEVSSGFGVTKAIGGTAHSVFEGTVVTATGNAVGAVNLAVNGILVYRVTRTYCQNGFGVGDISSSAGHTHIHCEDIYITGTGTGLARAGSGTIVGYIGHILESGSGIGNGTGINLFAGEMDLVIGRLDANVPYTSQAGTTLHMFAGEVIGTPTPAGTADVTIAGEIGNSADDIHTNFPLKAAPIGADIALIENSESSYAKSRTTLDAISGFTSNIVQVLTRHNSDNWGAISPRAPSGSAPVVNGDGFWSRITETYASATIAKDIYGTSVTLLGNTSARIETGTSVNMHAMEINPMARMKIALTDETVASRAFFGFTSIWGSGAVTVDDPAGTRAGLSYLGSSGNWAFTSKNNGGTEQRTDSGVAADTDPVEFLVELQGWATQTVLFSLFDVDGAILASATHTNVGGVPSGGNTMQFALDFELNVGNGGEGFKLYGAGGGNRYRA